MQHFSHLIEYILLPYISTIDLISLSKISHSFRGMRKLVIKKLSSTICPNLFQLNQNKCINKDYIYCDIDLYPFLIQDTTFDRAKIYVRKFEAKFKDIYIMWYDYNKLHFEIGRAHV